MALIDEQFKEAKKSNPSIKKYACEFLEYWENREGYWTCDKFVKQMERAVDIAEIK